MHATEVDFILGCASEAIRSGVFAPGWTLLANSNHREFKHFVPVWARSTTRQRPLGATRGERVDVRRIAATNRDLRRAVAAGQFRPDLFYRLNVIEVHLPPLRERPEDVPLLLEHFLARSAQPSPVRRFSGEALRLLLNYPWPGNVRELENTLERALILCPGEEITPSPTARAPRPIARAQTSRRTSGRI